jgi:hypothetical protein
MANWRSCASCAQLRGRYSDLPRFVWTSVPHCPCYRARLVRGAVHLRCASASQASFTGSARPVRCSSRHAGAFLVSLSAFRGCHCSAGFAWILRAPRAPRVPRIRRAKGARLSLFRRALFSGVSTVSEKTKNAPHMPTRHAGRGFMGKLVSWSFQNPPARQSELPAPSKRPAPVGARLGFAA